VNNLQQCKVVIIPTILNERNVFNFCSSNQKGNSEGVIPYAVLGHYELLIKQAPFQKFNTKRKKKVCCEVIIIPKFKNLHGKNTDLTPPRTDGEKMGMLRRDEDLR